MSPILIAHVGAGAVGLISGFAALALRKGSIMHRAAGTGFFVSMLFMALLGAYVAVFMPQRGTVFIGIVTAYLVATAWVTVRRKENTTGALFDYTALFAAIGTAAIMVFFGFMAANSGIGLVDSLPAVAHYPFAAIAALGAALDIKVIAQGGIAGAPRIARHLWRMCTALLIASFAFFIGQQKVMPEWLQGSLVLFVPGFAVLALMIFWLIKVRFTKWYDRTGAETVREAEHNPMAVKS